MAGWSGVVQVVGVVASGWVGGELVERGGAGGGGYKYVEWMKRARGGYALAACTIKYRPI